MSIEKLLEKSKAVVTTDLSKRSNIEIKYLRTLKIDEKEYFIAKDFAELLGYTNPQKAIRDHCKNYKSFDDLSKVDDSFTLDLAPILGNSWKQTKIIPESDIWRLIIRSEMPEAEKIEKWVMEDVLPSVRKNGYYIKDNLTKEQEGTLVEEVIQKFDRTYLDLKRQKMITYIIKYLTKEGYTKRQANSLMSTIYNYCHATIIQKTASTIIYDMINDGSLLTSIQSINTLRKYPTVYKSDFKNAINFYSEDQLSDFASYFGMIVSKAVLVISNKKIKPSAERVRAVIKEESEAILKWYSGLKKGDVLPGVNRIVDNLYEGNKLSREEVRDIKALRTRNFIVDYRETS